MKRRRGKLSKKKRLQLARARAARAWRRAVDLQYMGLAKKDRRRIAEVGLRQWINEVADAQLARKAKQKSKQARERQRPAA